ncbi:GNAT family N-acetyltransferase [Brachybacterium hainanense]|uniref:GNAT family N-acetyltransferase n=1 Tax=Brachybacterium hainanense TaxID=1541174 RepID=A0ABV6RDY5_9MICO
MTSTSTSIAPSAEPTGAGPAFAPLALEDAAELAALLTHLEHVDGIEETVDETDAREMLTSPGFDPATDGIGVRLDGELIGYASVMLGTSPDEEGFIRASLGGGVHAAHRRAGLGSRLLAFAERRAAELMAQRHPGRPYHLRASGGVSTSTVRPLLEREGYGQVRTWLDLARELPGEELAAPEIDGVHIGPARDEDSADVHAAHLAAFQDHWGYAPIDEARWASFWNSAKTRRDLASVARDASTGEVLAYVLTSVYEAGSLYIGLVGTVRSARGRGIARAALASTIARAAQDGTLHEATLEVDADSPTGATRLYEKVGFRTVRERVTYAKDMPAAAPARR